MQKGCLPDSTGNRKVKQAFLNKLSFQEHEQQQFLFINKCQKAPPNILSYVLLYCSCAHLANMK